MNANVLSSADNIMPCYKLSPGRKSKYRVRRKQESWAERRERERKVRQLCVRVLMKGCGYTERTLVTWHSRWQPPSLSLASITGRTKRRGWAALMCQVATNIPPIMCHRPATSWKWSLRLATECKGLWGLARGGGGGGHCWERKFKRWNSLFIHFTNIYG